MSATTSECADPISVDEASAQQVRLWICQLERCSRRALWFLDAEPTWRTWAACAGAWESLSTCISCRATCSLTSVAGCPQQLSRWCAQYPQTVPAHRVARVARRMLLHPSASAPPASVCSGGTSLPSRAAQDSLCSRSSPCTQWARINTRRFLFALCLMRRCCSPPPCFDGAGGAWRDAKVPFAFRL